VIEITDVRFSMEWLDETKVPVGEPPRLGFSCLEIDLIEYEAT